jgi:succinyl-CoA synthetase beta subunit
MILPEHEANRFLTAARIPMIPLRTVNSADEAKQAAAGLGYPVVLKLSSALHTHKTEVGGVVLNIADDQQLEEAFGKLRALRERLDPRAILILEPMAGSGAEFFVGFQRHRQFGPVLTFGLGGITLELFKDVAFRLLPACAADFREMLSELKAWPKMRSGFRNLPPVDEERTIRLLEQVTACVLDHPEILELDMNPVLMGAEHTTVLDATIILERR